MRVLVIFSNPPDTPHLRLDKEDKTLGRLHREFKDSVSIERLHASEIEDVHTVIINGGYDVIQFSGHGCSDGIYLEKSDYAGGAAELVSAKRVVHLINLTRKAPLLVVFLACYSDSFVEILSDAAPFVVTSKCAVTDEECITFIEGLYEWMFRRYSVTSAFDHAIHLLKAKGLAEDKFRLSRKGQSQPGDSLLVESAPDPTQDSILVNLNQVRGEFVRLGLSEPEICHLISRKLRVHYWIFERARESAMIPIGQLLFGEFCWGNVRDVVKCTRLIRLKPDTPHEEWEMWCRALTTYNDLASCEYRTVSEPASPLARRLLNKAVRIFQHHVDTCLLPMRQAIEKSKARGALSHIEFAAAETKRAADNLVLERYPQVVEALEMALTNYHEVVTALQPPEEKS